ncbi:MAG: hypothetical protein P8181_04260, partial [bacterium]
MITRTCNRYSRAYEPVGFWVIAFPILVLLILSSVVPAAAASASGRRPIVSINGHELREGPKKRIFVQDLTGDEGKLLRLREKLVSHGAEKTNVFLPSVIVCEMPVDADVAAIVGGADFTFTEESLVGLDASPSASEDRPAGAGGPERVSREIAFVKSCYDLARKIATGPAAPEDGMIGFEDVTLTVPKDVLKRARERQMSEQPNTSGLPRPRAPGASQPDAPETSRPDASAAVPRNYHQNSEFLIGNTLVQVIFPESEGSTEDWTDEELTEASAGAFAAAIAYQQTFHYVPIDFVFRSERRARTRYEPILHDGDTHGLWIYDVMRNLGYGGSDDILVSVHSYNNTGRASYGTDWVFTAFVARSRSQPLHRFLDASFTAYAYLGGPFLVIPFPAGNLDRDYDVSEREAFSRVFQHEMGHIFWALDEYPGSPPCDLESGYLSYQNRNSVDVSPAGDVVGCPDYVPCMMLGVMAPDRPICEYTAGQLGVINADRNSVPDIFDSPPVVEFENSAVETVLTPDIDIRMRATATAVPNNNPRQDPEERIDYTAPLRDAVLGINDIGSVWLQPVDGRWDSVEEDLLFKVRGLAPGLTRIQVKVRNVFGCSSEATEKKIYFVGVRIARFDLDVEQNHIRIRWETTGETFGAQFDLYRMRAAGSDADTLLVAADVRPAGDSAGLWRVFEYYDGDVTPGNEYRYFVRAHFSLNLGGEDRDFETVSNVFTARAMFPISHGQFISQVSPNPFSRSTRLSIDVPRSFTQMESDDDTRISTGLKTETVTDLQVTAYDVCGRAVKEIFSGRRFGQVMTFEWDGTNSKSEP